MCADMCVGMCVGMRTDICVDMLLDMRLNMCVDILLSSCTWPAVRIDICTAMGVGVARFAVWRPGCNNYMSPDLLCGGQAVITNMSPDLLCGG